MRSKDIIRQLNRRTPDLFRGHVARRAPVDYESANVWLERYLQLPAMTAQEYEEAERRFDELGEDLPPLVVETPLPLWKGILP